MASKMILPQMALVRRQMASMASKKTEAAAAHQLEVKGKHFFNLCQNLEIIRAIIFMEESLKCVTREQNKK